MYLVMYFGFSLSISDFSNKAIPRTYQSPLVYPLTPHFYIVKVGFTGVFIIFLFLLLNIYCGYSLEPKIYVLSKNMKIVKQFQLKIVNFTAVKNRCILHGRVFVMVRISVEVELDLIAIFKKALHGYVKPVSLYISKRNKTIKYQTSNEDEAVP